MRIETTQLVLCVVLHPEETFTLTKCSLLTDPVAELRPLHAATYQVTIREVRTRRQVASLTLPGDDNLCPEWVRQNLDPVPSFWPKPATWDDALRPYLSGEPVRR